MVALRAVKPALGIRLDRSHRIEQPGGYASQSQNLSPVVESSETGVRVVVVQLRTS
jgi:hypothetical protein